MELIEERFKLDSNKINKEQIMITGIMLVIILLLIGIQSRQFLYIKISIPILLINIIYPKIFYPAAVPVVGLFNWLSAFVQKVFLMALYVIMIIPMGLLRRLTGKDSLQLHNWKKGNSSVMKNINHTYIPLDLEKPY